MNLSAPWMAKGVKVNIHFHVSKDRTIIGIDFKFTNILQHPSNKRKNTGYEFVPGAVSH